MSTQFTTSNTIINKDRLTILLRDIETFKGPLEKFDLKRVCDCNPLVYGQRGTTLRRHFQYKFKYLKDRYSTAPVWKYLQLLREHGVEASVYTQQRLLTEKEIEDAEEGLKNLTLTSEDSLGITQKKTANISEEEDDITDYGSENEEASMSSDVATPTRGILRSPSGVSSSHHRQHSPSQSAQSTELPSIGLARLYSPPRELPLATSNIEQAWKKPEEGTREDPYIVNVNIKEA